MQERLNIDEIIHRALDKLSPELQGMREEIGKFMHANLSAMLERMNLVSREEYDIQVQLLDRLRQRIDELEATVKRQAEAEKDSGKDKGK